MRSTGNPAHGSFNENRTVRAMAAQSLGRLGATDRLGFAFHLSWCRHCRRYVRQMDATVAAIRAEHDYRGLSVIVARRACVTYARTIKDIRRERAATCA